LWLSLTGIFPALFAGVGDIEWWFGIVGMEMIEWKIL
jgi:hypothetical protein